jgi:predicted dinucleotide-binding enzyme
MSIGIIGAGLIGTAFARRLAHSNIPAILSNSRGPDSGEAAALPQSRSAVSFELNLPAVNRI